MGMGGPSGNQPLLFALGVVALDSVDHLQTYFTLQHRHPDGHRWLDLGHFATRGDAEAAMRAVIAAGHASTDVVRVLKVTRDAT